VASLIDGAFELDVFVVLGVALQDTRDEVVVEGGVGEGLAQRILLVCPLLGQVSRVGPGVRVGRVVRATLMGRGRPVVVKQ
jgi:hypothetical protein